MNKLPLPVGTPVHVVQNEFGEGGMLAPTERLGRSRLEAVKSSVFGMRQKSTWYPVQNLYFKILYLFYSDTL